MMEPPRMAVVMRIGRVFDRLGGDLEVTVAYGREQHCMDEGVAVLVEMAFVRGALRSLAAQTAPRLDIFGDFAS